MHVVGKELFIAKIYLSWYMYMDLIELNLIPFGPGLLPDFIKYKNLIISKQWKYSKGDCTMSHIVQFLVMNPHQ